MPDIFKRKDGRYMAWVWVPDPKNPYGPKIKKPVYDRDRQKLKIKINEIENRVYKRTYADAGDLCVGAYLWDYYKANTASWEVTTQELYAMYIEVHFNPKIGFIKMNGLLPIHIQNFYNEKMQDEYDEDGKLVRKKLSANTIHKLNSFLNQAFEFAVQNYLLYQNPCKAIKLPEKTEYIPTVYTEEMMGRLLDAVKGTYDEVYIVLAAFSGLRRGEVLGLRWRDVDFEKKTISINRTKVHFMSTREKNPKSKKSKRTFIASSFVVDILKRYRNSLKVISEFVCDKYTPQSHSDHFSNLLDKLGLPHIRFHDLRHYAGTMMTKYGVPDPVIQQVLGHSDTKTTRIYQHVLDDMQKLAADALDRSYRKAKQS
jgi:integrase